MARTKGDFLSYAKSGVRPGTGPGVIEIDDASFNDGNENSGSDLYGTNESYDEPASITSPSSGRSLQTSYYDLGNEQGAVGVQQDEDGGIYGEYSSSNGITPDSGIRDIPIRNVNTGAYPIISSVSGPTRTVKKKRVNTIDKLLGVAGNKLPRSKTTKKTNAAPAQQSTQKVMRRFLTLIEVNDYRRGLINIVMWSSDHLDDGLTAITKGHRQVNIWSSMEWSDAEIIVDAFLEAGQKSEYWASAVRQVVEYSKKAQLLAIVTPKLYFTIMYLVTTGIDLRLA